MENTTLKPMKYLVCVDKRDESRVALRLAMAKAYTRGGQVDMIHIIPPTDFQSLGGVVERMKKEQREAAEALMGELAAEVQEQSGLMPSITIREGAIGEEILAAAMDDVDAAMLVLGVAAQNAGRGQLVSWLAANLGAKLLIPLLLVPGNLTDQQLEALI